MNNDPGSGGRALDLADRDVLQSLLAEHGLAPLKRLGQHFLISRAVLGEILDAIGATPSAVLEIGPGPGVLTQQLVRTGHRVLAIEVDRGWVSHLRALPEAASGALYILESDALKLDWTRVVTEYFGSEVVTVTGNLPYYITGPLVARLWDAAGLPWGRAVFMVQRETAERLAAEPGHSSLAGIPSVMLRSVARIVHTFDVPRTAFYPSPQVDSAVVVLERMTGSDPVAGRALSQVVRAGFGQRRKTLRQALTALGGRGSEWATRLADLGIDPGRRAESLTMEEWRRLASYWDGRQEA